MKDTEANARDAFDSARWYTCDDCGDYLQDSPEEALDELGDYGPATVYAFNPPVATAEQLRTMRDWATNKATAAAESICDDFVDAIWSGAETDNEKAAFDRLDTELKSAIVATTLRVFHDLNMGPWTLESAGTRDYTAEEVERIFGDD